MFHKHILIYSSPFSCGVGIMVISIFRILTIVKLRLKQFRNQIHRIRKRNFFFITLTHTNLINTHKKGDKHIQRLKYSLFISVAGKTGELCAKERN